MTETREALITALVPVTIADCGITLSVNSSAYVPEYTFQKSKQIPDLLAIRAIKVEWVTRHRSRRVPEMKPGRYHPYEASNVYQPTLPTPAPAEITEVPAKPQDSANELVEKVGSLEKELAELKSLIPSLSSIRELLQEIVAPVSIATVEEGDAESLPPEPPKTRKTKKVTPAPED